MKLLSFDDVESWVVATEPVVFFRGWDFAETVDEHIIKLETITEACGLSLASLRIADPPGVVVKTYKGNKVPKLVDPLIKVSKKDTPWLFCVSKGCRNRITTPGGVCHSHVGK